MHARQKFYEARTSDPARSHVLLAWIVGLYEVEEEAKKARKKHSEWDDAAWYAHRLELQRQRSRPILDAIGAWLKGDQPKALPKSPIGEAIGYSLNHWEALTRKLVAGFLEIDNGESERTLKPEALGRKNWLFIGSDEGGETAAVLTSLCATCKAWDVDPFAYLRDVLDRVSAHPMRRIEELLPDCWKPLEGAAPLGLHQGSRLGRGEAGQGRRLGRKEPARARVAVDGGSPREIDVVIVRRLDRWGRSTADLMTTLHELSDLGVGFPSLTEALDLTAPTGRAADDQVRPCAESVPASRMVLAGRMPASCSSSTAGICRSKRSGCSSMPCRRRPTPRPCASWSGSTGGSAAYAARAIGLAIPPNLGRLCRRGNADRPTEPRASVPGPGLTRLSPGPSIRSRYYRKT
jgi:hypothetical protein